MSGALAACGGRELACPWCFTSCFTCALVLPAARSLPPLACQAVLEESRVSLHHPVLPVTQSHAGSSPSHGQCHLRPARCGNSRELRCIPRWVQTLPRSTVTRNRSGTVGFNLGHSYSLRQRLSCLCLPSFPALRKGETLRCQRWHVGGRDSEIVGRQLPLGLIWWKANFKAAKKKEEDKVYCFILWGSFGQRSVKSPNVQDCASSQNEKAKLLPSRFIMNSRKGRL